MEIQEAKKQEERGNNRDDTPSSDNAIEQGEEQVEIEYETKIPLKTETTEIPKVQNS
jgi:hypothetical protein